MNILLTNDDSHDSPLFHMLIAAAKELGNVEIVVPAQEQSWQGKSMTRYGPLYAERIDLHGTPAWSVTGTPADCVNMGIYSLLEQRPDLVLSGINIGTNTGTSFALASGTLGACFEGNIAGLPGLALSQVLTSSVYHLWSDERRFEDAVINALRTSLAQVLPAIWEQFLAEFVEGQQPRAVTWSVNLPATLQDTTIVRTRLGDTRYGRCFAKRGDQYHHQLRDVRIDQHPETDAMVNASGKVSATLIDLSILGQQI